MGMYDIWPTYGFSRNPYDQRTLPPTEEGEALLAGRDVLLRTAKRLIGTPGASPTFEGPVGAGKTSLLNVASYEMYKDSLERKAKELWLPASEVIQMPEDQDEFEAEVYRIVLQTVVKFRGAFFTVGLQEPKIRKLNTWLNQPQYAGWAIGAGAAGFSASTSRSNSPSGTPGFVKSGFPAAIRSVIDEAYGPTGTGGVICILDNMELAGSVSKAVKVLDTLRDRVLSVPRIRWVLCGSRGIISRARTQRLSGEFMAPERITVLTEDSVVGAVDRRIRRYGSSSAVPPLTPEAFKYLYQMLNQNLRDSMTWSQNFAHWLVDQYDVPNLPAESERFELMRSWLRQKADDASRSIRLQPAAWTLFERICREGAGRSASSEFESKYGFEDQQQGSGYVTALCNANLMVREVDPEDGRATINVVTADGWLSFHSRAGNFKNNVGEPR